MGEVSGVAARAWRRRRRDQRLGYSALALGAGGFVLVLAGTLIVTEVVPGLLDEDPEPQAVVPSSVIGPQEDGSDDGPASAPGGQVVITAGSVLVPVAAPGRPGDQAPEAPPTAEPEQPSQPGQPTQPGQPGPGPQPAPEPEGPVGSVLDPVVEAVAGTADGATGGATKPVTQPVVGLVDGLTDTVDGILTVRR